MDRGRYKQSRARETLTSGKNSAGRWRHCTKEGCSWRSVLDCAPKSTHTRTRRATVDWNASAAHMPTKIGVELFENLCEEATHKGRPQVALACASVQLVTTSYVTCCTSKQLGALGRKRIHSHDNCMKRRSRTCATPSNWRFFPIARILVDTGGPCLTEQKHSKRRHGVIN